jgi:hypothetical protein
MSDWASWAYGGTALPLTTSTTNSLLRDADPALFYTLTYFQSVINTYVGPRLIAEAAKAPAVTQVTTAISAVVPFDPAPYLTENQGITFPLLSLHRIRERFEDHTIAHPHSVSEWVLQYVLPPINAGQAERLIPILGTIGKTLHNRIENMFDPSFSSGLRVWQAAGVESIKLMTAEYGRWEHGNGLAFPTWKAVIEVRERVDDVAGNLQPLSGLDSAIDIASSQSPTVVDFASLAVTFVDPATIPGIVSIWSPDNAVVASDGERVASVPCSISANVLSQSTGTNQPTLIPAALKDIAGRTKSVVRYDGIASFMTATVASLANDSSRTIVALFRLSNTTQRSSLVAQTLSADTGAHSLALEANTQASAGGHLGAYLGGSSYDSQLTTDQSWHVGSLIITSTTNGSSITSSSALQVDGSAAQSLAIKSGTGTWQGMATANQIAVGAIPGIANTNAACDIGPILVFNAALTSAQLNTAITYCRQWGGLT